MNSIKIFWKKYTENRDWSDYWLMVLYILLIPSAAVIVYGIFEAIVYSHEVPKLATIDTVYNLIVIVVGLSGFWVGDIVESLFKRKQQEKNHENS